MAKDGVVQAGSVVGGRGAAPDPARGKPPETPAPFPFRSWLPERSSPSRVRCAAPDRRALDRSGPFQALHLTRLRLRPTSLVMMRRSMTADSASLRQPI